MENRISKTFKFVSFPKPMKVLKTRRIASNILATGDSRGGKVKKVKLQVKFKKPKKQPTIKSLERKLKSILYPLIKKRDGPTCISCGKKNLKGADWQAGHYIKAELCSMFWRYNVRNINSQCSSCNLWKRGNTIDYRIAMIKKYGQILVNELDKHHKEDMLMVDNRKFLEDMIEHYKLISHL